MERLTLLDSVKTLFSKLDDDPIYKTIFIDSLKFGFETKDYISLIERISKTFAIPLKDTQKILILLGDINEVDIFEPALTNGQFNFFKALAITYGEQVKNIRAYLFAEHKMLLNESSITKHRDRIGLTIKRIDAEEFYYELDLYTSLQYTKRIIESWRELLIKNGLPDDHHDYFAAALELKGAISLLSREIQPISRGDVGNDSNKNG